MPLESLDAFVDHIILVSFVVLLLELEHKDSTSLLALGQVLIEGREFLTVLKTVILEISVVMSVDALALDVPVVVDYKYQVRGDVDIEFATPKIVFLGHLQRLDGILGESRLFAVPEAPVGGYGDFRGT